MIRKHIPNTITCLNIASGCVATVFALQGETNVCGMAAYNWAYIFIGIAAVMDFLDGFAARLLGAYSDMGKELDSLCDCVSFGVAPAMLVYATLAPQGGWLPWVAIVIPVAGALRLAKFNIDTRQTTSFIGLPIPANAIFWIGYTAYCHAGFTNLTLPYIVVPVVLMESYLMLSELKLFSLKFKTWGWKGNAFRWLLIVTAIVSVVVFGVPGLMWLILGYLLYGIIDNAKASDKK